MCQNLKYFKNLGKRNTCFLEGSLQAHACFSGLILLFFFLRSTFCHVHIITRAKNIKEKENPHPSNLRNVSRDFSNVRANVSPFGFRETRGFLWRWKAHRPTYSHKKIIAKEKRQENMLLPITPALQSHPTPPRKVPSQCHQLDLRYPSKVSSKCLQGATCVMDVV